MIKIEEGILVGTVTHYFNKIGVAVVALNSSLKCGDTIRITKGGNPKFSQIVESIEIEHEQVEEAKAGEEIGLKVKQVVRKGCSVFKL